MGSRERGGTIEFKSWFGEVYSYLWLINDDGSWLQMAINGLRETGIATFKDDRDG